MSRKRKLDDDADREVRPNPAMHVAGNVVWMQKLDDELLEQRPRAIEQLGYELSAFSQTVSPEPVDHERREGLIRCLRTRVQRYFPGAEVQASGSTATGLYLPGANIDISVTWPGANAAFGSANAEDRVLLTLKEILETDAHHGRLAYRGSAQVPKLIISNTYGFYNVEIAYGRTEGLQALPFVARLLERWPVARPLILVLKAYLRSVGLSTPYNGGIGGFAVVVMVGWYLQTHPRIIDQARFDDTIPANWGLLLIYFFHCFGDIIDYGTWGITMRGGGTFRRLPEGPIQLFVESPLEAGVNLTKGCRLYDLQHAFRNARASLMDAVKFHEAEQDHRSTPTWAAYLRQVGESHGSVLHALIGLDDEMMNSTARAEQYFPIAELRAFLQGLGLT